MVRTLLLSFALVVASLASAQTYFYIDEIVVQPAAPTSDDVVFLDLIGNLSSSGAYVVSASAQTVGTVVTINIVAADPGGLAVLVPHTETVQVGQLAEGTYTVVINGTFVADFAPTPQHQFTVTAGGGPTCNDLAIGEVRWHAFDNGVIVLQVFNNGPIGFGYPNFILYDANGDTLAKEVPDFFALGEESWHTLPLHPDATAPVGTFNGTVELWTGFGEVLACTWPVMLDLCPPAPCATLYPTVQNLGGALAIGTYNWSLFDDGFVLVGSGTLEMTDVVQYDTDTICLTPGNYSIAVAMNQPPTGGAPYSSVTAEGGISGASLPVPWDLPVLMPFTFYEPCIDGTNDVSERVATAGISATQQGDALLVRTLDGAALGVMTLHDAQGKLIHQGKVAADNTVVHMGDARGLFVLRTERGVLKVEVLR